MAEGRSLHLSVAAASPSDLFEEGCYPYPGRMLKEPVRDHLLTRVRAARTTPTVDLTFRFEHALTDPERERFGQELRAYYEAAMVEAHADLRANQVEARRTFVLGLIGSAIALGIAIPLRLYVGFDFYIVEFLCVVVVWILMWDSIEMLLWDAMLLRMRYRAIRKLRDATIYFATTSIEGSAAVGR